MARRTKGFITSNTDITHGGDGFFQVLTRIKLGRVLSQETTDRPGGRQTQVCIDVDLAHTVLDAFLDFFHRHPIGFRNFTTEFIDDGQPVLRHGRGPVHDQVGIRNALVNRLDLLDGEDVTSGRASKLVGAMAGADGNRQGIYLGFLYEIRRFFRVGEHLLMGQLAFRTDAIFFTGFTGFQ